MTTKRVKRLLLFFLASASIALLLAGLSSGLFHSRQIRET